MEFLFVGNARWLDWVNTEVILGGQRVDLLESRDALQQWLHEAELPAGAVTLTQAHEHRALLRAVAEGLVARQTVSPSHHREFNRYLADAPGAYRLEGQKLPYVLHWDPDRDHALLRLTLDAAATLSTDAWQRVRRCENPDCILYYLDTSKNGTRRWCSMALCGNREKATRHYRKLRRA